MNEAIKEVKKLITPDDVYIIFVNGVLEENNLNSYGEINRDFDEEKLNFIQKNTNNFNFINISNDSKIKIFHIINQEDIFETIINVSQNINVTIYEYLHVSSSSTLVTQLIGNDNSNTKILTIKEGSRNGKLDYSFQSYLSKNAHLQINNFNVNKGAGLDIISGELLAEQSTLAVYCVDLNNSQKTHKTDVIARHKVGYSKSNFSCFGMAKNNSHSLINTLGIIENKASESNMNHNIKGILLDESSSINTNPILEIDEFDVVASHGASVGDLSEDELYYLMSRGLTLEQSQKLILSGLVMPILDDFEDKLYHDFVSRLISENL